MSKELAAVAKVIAAPGKGLLAIVVAQVYISIRRILPANGHYIEWYPLAGGPRGGLRVAHGAVDLAQEIFGNLAGSKIMVLGAGETSERTARSFRSHGAKQLFVSNRSFDKALALAEAMGGKAIRFDDWEQELRDVDILVSSTAAPHAVVTRAKIEPILRMRRDRPLFIIDLAIPRDVEPTVRQLDDVYVYDLDSLRMIADRTLEARRNEMDACENLIEQHPNFETTLMVGEDSLGSTNREVARA